MIRRPPRSTLSSSSAASDVYKRQPPPPRPATAAGHRAAPPAPGRSPGRHRWRIPVRSRRVDDRWVILVRTRAWVPSRDLSGDREEPTPAVIYTGEETRPNSRWLDDITADAPFQAQWKGFDHVEGWAARYPDVVDYYLGNGKELLNQNIQALLTILRRRQDPGDSRSLRPSDISGDLLSLDRALNSHDPHYRYEFRVSVDPPPLIEEPRLIAVQQERLDGRWTTYWLFCRYDDAISDRPPPTIQLRFAAEPGSELHQQLADMATYGTPLQAATASFSADLPGGLGGHFDEGAVTIGPAHPVGAQPYVIRLVLVDPQGHELAAVRCDMQPITQGFTGEGSRAWGQETNGVFAVELRINQPTERATINIRTLDVSGKAPHDVVGGLRWLRAFRPPNALKVGPPHGPAPSQGLPIPDHGDLEVEALLAVAENLAVIQNYVTAQLMMPAEVTAEQFEAIRHAARLLKDQVMIGTWNSWTVAVGADASHDLDTEPGSMSSVMVVGPLVITLDGSTTSLASTAKLSSLPAS